MEIENHFFLFTPTEPFSRCQSDSDQIFNLTENTTETSFNIDATTTTTKETKKNTKQNYVSYYSNIIRAYPITLDENTIKKTKLGILAVLNELPKSQHDLENSTFCDVTLEVL